MLVLARREGERIHMVLPDGEEIVILVTDLDRNVVRLGIDAPETVKILREELLQRHAVREDDGTPE